MWVRVAAPERQAGQSVLPTPQQRLTALADFYKSLSPRTILRETLGYSSNILPGTPTIAAPLVEHLITICVDTESSTNNTDLMTELGINIISRKDARSTGNPGPHGHKLQEQLKFFHFRVVEHAHLLSNRTNSLGPLGNRFGHTRFATFVELRIILEHLFVRDIETDDPLLKGCKHPVVLVGHALRHDEENAKKIGLNYDFATKDTIVAKVDTQQLAREVGDWVPLPGMLKNEIGLRVLIEKLGFKHLNDHTACNDAARTMMCGIHMILPDKLRHGDSPSMQTVADRVEAQSKITSPALYGTVECCFRCGSRDHSMDVCTTTVTCPACERFDVGSDQLQNVHSHIETHCQHVARFKAWARRYRDAYMKNRAHGKPFSAEVLAGPGAEAHPWSTWRGLRDGLWPMTDLSDVLVGMRMSTEPEAQVCNLQSALGGLEVPSTGSWAMDVSPGYTNGARSAANPAFPSLPPATSRSEPPPSATHVVTMSEQRGHGRGGVVRGNGRDAQRCRGGLSGGRGSGSSGRGGGANGDAPGQSWGW
ncbi:hypothetical protein N0V94_006743 [Neodidymelliopsis sp. IMI 364377]|nr:hypothetical protein N0V94_006743 [Neodidymelliopsis sp. IMI 364377]